MSLFPHELASFADGQDWTPDVWQEPAWPHEFLLRAQAAIEPFDRLALHIRRAGHEGMLGQKLVVFLNVSGMIYWIDSDAAEPVEAVYRCSRERLWEYRFEYGSLPEPIGRMDHPHDHASNIETEKP